MRFIYEEFQVYVYTWCVLFAVEVAPHADREASLSYRVTENAGSHLAQL